MRQLVLDCYLEENPESAAQRFWRSKEFEDVQRYAQRMGIRPPGLVADIGGGAGVSALAWSWAGYKVVLVEPDDDDVVGYRAIARKPGKHRGVVSICSGFAESLPLRDGVCDIVYFRQVLHHTQDLGKACAEARRVLRKGGLLIATREHVIDKEADKAIFLAEHPTHKYIGGENAFQPGEYLQAISGAGFRNVLVLRSWDSVINYFPVRSEDVKGRCVVSLERRCGRRLGELLAGRRMIQMVLTRRWSKKDCRPGRMHSFFAR